jgi:hypothetical protein
MNFARYFTTLLFLTCGVLKSSKATGQPVAPVSTPSPEQIAEGRVHFDRGVTLFDQNNFDGSIVEFQRAWELSQRPSVLFNIATACQALHRYAEAIEALDRYVSVTTAQDRQRRQAERTVQELRELIGWVQIDVDPTDALISLDGRATQARVELMVGPGTHRVEASRSGRHPGLAEFTIASGEHRTVRFRLTDDSSSTQPIVVVTEPTRSPAEILPPLSTATTLTTSSVDIQGAPTDALIQVDSVPQSSRGPRVLASGPHRFSVTARGMQPWSGTLALRANIQHRLAISLAPDQPGISPGWFWGATVTTGVLLFATIGTGVAALNTHSEYAALPFRSPRLIDLESRGRTLGVVADLFGVLTLGAGATAVYLFTKTRFDSRTSTATFVLAPTPGGGIVAVGSRF